MRKILMLWVCGMLLWVQKGIADEIKPLCLSKGQKYELRISNISVVCPGPEKTEFEKTVNQDLYEFEVKEVHRKEGYVLEMKHCRSDMYVFRKFPDDPLWYEVNFRNSEIHAPALASGEVQGYMEKYPFVVRLTSDFRIPDSLKVKKWFTPLLAEAFAGGKQAIYRMTDTLLKQEAGFCEKETEVRFTLSDTLPFVVTFGEEDCRVGVLNRTNTRLRGEIKHAQGVEYILLDMSTLLPFYEDRIYRIPVVNGKFDFRLQLEQPMEYIKMLGGYYLYLEPGDDLVMEIDSLTDREIRFSGLGAGNNRYYHREISGWWDSLSRLRQEKTNCREFYMALESMADEYSHRIATLKSSFTLTFYRHMLNFFKYQQAYEKLMAGQDSTVEKFDCMRGVELCNPLAVDNADYLLVLRQLMLFVMPERLSSLGQAGIKKRNHYERAVALLDGKVLNVFLAGIIAEALTGNFERGKLMYDRYKADYLLSPYSNTLEQVFLKAGTLAPGSPAPDFTLKNPEGRPVSLSDFRGKVVYIDFWATGCGPCMYELKNTVPALENYFKDKDVVFLNISSDSKAETWKKTLTQYSVQGVNLLDTKDREVSRLYMVRGTPHYVLIGKDGELIHSDAPRPSNEKIKQMIEEALDK